jgi:hypothetical protein
MASLFPRRKRNKPTPTRQQSGTTYAPKGVQGVKPPNANELGSELGTKLFDRVPEVGTGITAAQTYKRMMRDDASVRVSLRAGKAPVLGAEYFIDPFDKSEEQLLIWDFVDFNLFGGMTSPWAITLEKILKMYESARANSSFELVWENREWAPKRANPNANRKQYTMLRKMAYRPDTTIKEIALDDNGGPTGIVQQAIRGDNTTEEVTIPIDKAVIFQLNQEEEGFEGMPMLRSAYKHWYYKNRFYAIDGIQKERHGMGVPDIEVQPGASQDDWALAKILGKNLRTNEYAYIVRPPTVKVGFAQLSGNLVEPIVSAEHHDTMIMKNIMVQFLNMGAGEGGGRAASATAMDMFLKAMRHIANSICDAFNLYVIPPLVAYNFDTNHFPQLKVRNVGEAKDLQMWSSAMRNLIGVGAISVDEETEAWIREQLDMPKLQTPWVPFEKRPTNITEFIKPDGTTGQQLGGNGSTPTPQRTPALGVDRSKNGGGGNLGKSPSSSAV